MGTKVTKKLRKIIEAIMLIVVGVMLGYLLYSYDVFEHDNIVNILAFGSLALMFMLSIVLFIIEIIERRAKKAGRE